MRRRSTEAVIAFIPISARENIEPVSPLFPPVWVLKISATLSPSKVALQGTGRYIQLSATSLNFGNQPVGTKSLSKRVTLSNKGSVAVNFTSISITGTDSNDFAETSSEFPGIGIFRGCRHHPRHNSLHVPRAG